MDIRRIWNPSTDLDRLRNEFDELLGHFGFDRNELTRWPTTSNRPPVVSSVDGRSSWCTSI